MLSYIAFHAHTNLYGTFLCDNAREMQKYETKERTTSLWSKILSKKEKFTNAFFNDSESFAVSLMPDY